MDKSLCDRIYCGVLSGAYKLDSSQAGGMSREQLERQCSDPGYVPPKDFCTDPTCSSFVTEMRFGGKDPCRPALPLRIAPPLPKTAETLRPVVGSYQVTMEMVHRPQCVSRCQFSRWVAGHPLAAGGLILLGYLLLSNGGSRK